jgi:TRAP transporter TAXI family solute receptor
LNEKFGLELVNQSSNGTPDNFSKIIDPKSSYKIALMQTDYLYAMQAIDLKNNTNKTSPIKVILPMAKEEIHVITTENSGIKKLQDLEKKRVAIGTKGQGSYITASFIKDRSQVKWHSHNIPFDDMLHELSRNKIDAFIYVSSAPINKLNLDPQIMRNKITMVELNDFNNWARYYENDTIHASEYKWLDHDIPTFSVQTLLVVNESKLTENEKAIVSGIQKGILNNIDVLKAQGHPKWSEIKPEDSDWPLYK